MHSLHLLSYYIIVVDLCIYNNIIIAARNDYKPCREGKGALKRLLFIVFRISFHVCVHGWVCTQTHKNMHKLQDGFLVNILAVGRYIIHGEHGFLIMGVHVENYTRDAA